MTDKTTIQEGTLSSDAVMAQLRERLSKVNSTVSQQEVSAVIEVADGIARVAGLRSAMAGELLEFTSSVTGHSVFGLAQNLDETSVGAVLFGEVSEIKEGDECRTTGRVMDIPAGFDMLGRVVNPLGQPIDGLGAIHATHRRPIEFKAPGIMQRQPVCEPVQTGLLAIDAMVPVGRGQRELIIGDRKTGKTAIAIDAIVNQKNTDMVCIYVAIGQKASTVANIRESLSRHGVLDKTVIVAATAADSAPMQYIAPMAGAAIGEFFMYNDKDGKPADKDHPGGHVLVVYDDLSKQAVAYRQMSLTLHRPPGREAYPGDIIGLPDNGIFKIGDTITDGEQLHFLGLPSFSPEMFKYIENDDPMKTKQLNKGIDQLMDEGVAQLFVNQFNNRKIIGTVGQLQFEVIQYRLENEYNAKCRWEPVHLYKACWIEADSEAELENFKKRKYQYMAKDKEGRDVFLADSSYVLSMAQQDFEHIKFHFTSEF